MRSYFNDTQGIQLLRGLLAEGYYIFTMDEASGVARTQNIPESQLLKILSKMVARNWLIRLRRGLYAGTGSLLGSMAIHPYAIATHLVKPSAISHWSAMQHHGFTEQIPHIVSAVTPHKVVTPSMRKMKNAPQQKHAWEVEGVLYEYITVKPQHFFGIEDVWIDENFCIPITDRERTLLDAFIFSSMFGGMGEVLGIVETCLLNLDVEKLINYAIRYEQKAVAKRLGWALEYFGIPIEQLTMLLQIPVQHYIKLEPANLRNGTYNQRWMILNNLEKNT